jgi:PAS domain S-box-containing protein
LQNLASVQSSAFATAAWEYDIDQINNLLADLQKLSVIKSVSVHGSSEDVIGHFGEWEADPEDPEFKNEQPLVYEAAAVKETIGKLVITVHSGEIWNGVKAHVQTNALTLIVLVLIMVLATAIVTDRVIGQPLQRLKRAMERIRSEKIHEAVYWQSADELGQVVQAYNEMQGGQAAAEAEVKQSQENLEALVEKRTQAFQDSEARVRSIIENAVDSIIVIDMQAIIESFSPAAEGIFGYTADEVIGQNVKMLVPEIIRDELDGYLEEYHRTGKSDFLGHTREVTGVRKDGRVIPMEIAIGESGTSDRRIYTAIIRDITERMKADDVLRENFAELEKFNRLAVDRELRMIELKREINTLLEKSGEEPIYDIVE